MTDNHHHDGHEVGARTADVRSPGIRVDRVATDVGVREAREHFGGIDIPATLAGTVAALGTAVILGGILGGLGRIGYQTGAAESGESLTIAGFIGGLVTLLGAFLVGGWVAGRMSRYDGARNGLVSALWFLLLTAGAAALGAVAGDRYDLFSRFDLPRWFRTDDATPAAIASALAAVAVVFAAAWFGGRLGNRYHQRADALIVDARDGGIVRPEVRARGNADVTDAARRQATR